MATENPPDKLPVIATASAAIKMPFVNWNEFFRLASILLALIFLRLLIATPSTPYVLSAHGRIGLVRGIIGLLLALALAVASVPFQIAWIRLTLNGPKSVINRPIWIFGRVEGGFLIGALALVLVMIGPFAIGVAFALATRDLIQIFLVAVAVGLLIAGFALGIRLWFIPIELALQRYKGPRTSWNQSKGMAWRLFGLSLLLAAPPAIAAAICDEIQASTVTYAGWVGLAVIGSIFTVAMHAWAVGGIALAYKRTAPPPAADAAIAAS